MPTAPLTPTIAAKPKTLSSRQWWLATAAGVLVISGLAYFLLVSPQWQRVGPGAEFDVAALQQTQSQREAELEQLKALKANYDKIAPNQIEAVSRVLPNTRAVPELLQQIESIARSSGTELIDVGIADLSEPSAGGAQPASAAGPLANTRGLKILSIQLQVAVDTYKNLRQFLDALQTNQRIFDVESYLFATDQDTQSFTIKAYYLPTKP